MELEKTGLVNSNAVLEELKEEMQYSCETKK